MIYKLKGFILKFLLISIAIQLAKAQYSSSCSEAFEPLRGSGIYHIELPQSQLEPFAVYCLEDEQDVRPWTVIQRRINGDTDFFRNWEEYRLGFGDLEGNFWIGLDKLHALTSDPNNPQELWIQLKDNVTANARYSRFSIGNEFEQYRLNELGVFTGTPGDAMRRHLGMKYSTFDYDNDTSAHQNCAVRNHGAWWYKNCSDSNLNGLYGSKEWSNGINWDTWRGPYVSMHYAHMAIRPARK